MLKSPVLKCVFVLVLWPTVVAQDVNELYMERLMANLNTSVDPCEDFYEFACGNWSRNYQSTEYIDMPGYMDNKVNRQLWAVLKEHRNRTGLYRSLHNALEACTTLDGIVLNPLLRLVQQELHMTWPIFRANWSSPWQNETQFDWLGTVASLRVYGFNGVFITQNINVLLTNASHHLLEINQHLSTHELYAKDVQDIFVRFGMTPEQSRQLTESVMVLEAKMKNLSYVEYVTENEAEAQKYEDNFKTYTVQELMERVPHIEWQRYFEIILERPVRPELERVQIFALNFDYFQKLLAILNGTSNGTICHYIMLKFMYQLNVNLPKNRSMDCIKYLRGYMPLAMNYLYEEHIYAAKRALTDRALLQIYERLRENFGKLLVENYLQLDAKERRYIHEELETMRLKIGNIPANHSEQFVSEYYRSIELNATDFYGNHLRLLRFNARLQLSKLANAPVPEEEQFYDHEPETASSSSPSKIFDNVILIPYGYLQMPFFHHDLCAHFQYSLFGFILAHEIIHAYDLFHIVYDQKGNYNSMGLKVAQHFWPYIHCFAQSPGDILSENIADVSGLRLAYRTYFDDVASPSADSQHSALWASTNFSAEQLFFINSVQFLCANMAKIGALDLSSFQMEHDMHDARVRQNWANFEEFAAAFECEPDSVMHPTQKCRLW